jgi:Flp pilus assembly protein CpaB
MTRIATRTALMIGTAFMIGCSRVDDSESTGQEPPILVAAQDLPSGTVLKAEHLRPSTRIRVKERAPFVEPQMLNEVVDRKLVFSLAAGEPVAWACLERLKREN